MHWKLLETNVIWKIKKIYHVELLFKGINKPGKCLGGKMKNKRNTLYYFDYIYLTHIFSFI